MALRWRHRLFIVAAAATGLVVAKVSMADAVEGGAQRCSRTFNASPIRLVRASGIAWLDIAGTTMGRSTYGHFVELPSSRLGNTESVRWVRRQ